MISHHPTEELLLEYASGVLPLGQKLALTVHLHYCDQCRQSYLRLRALGGALLNDLPSQEVDVDSFKSLKETVLAKVSGLPVTDLVSGDHEQSMLIEEQDVRDKAPAVLQRWIPKGFNELVWFSCKPGFKVVTLFKSNQSQVALSRVKPGGKMAHHRHTGIELTVVLKGAFSDENGLYKQGDFIFRDNRDHHHPVVTKDDECICLMVTEAPIQFTGKFARLLNPLLRLQHS